MNLKSDAKSVRRIKIVKKHHAGLRGTPAGLAGIGVGGTLRKGINHNDISGVKCERWQTRPRQDNKQETTLPIALRQRCQISTQQIDSSI